MSPVSIRSLVRETAVYGISGVLARSMGLLLLPVLSNFLPLDQFGHLTLTFVLIGLIQLFLVFGMGNSLVRHLIGAENKKAVFSSHFWPLFAVSTSGSLAVFLSAESIARYYFAEPLPGDSQMIRLAAVILWLDALNILPYSLLRALNRPFTYLAGILLSAVVYAALVVYLLAFRDSGMTGVLTANVIGSTAVFLFFTPLLKKFLRPVFDKKAFRVYFAFGFPIIFSSLGKILIDMSGRWLLDRMMGAEQVAYYSAGFRLASVANLAVAAFTLAWKPFLVRASEEQDSDKIFARVMTFSAVALCFLFLAVSFLADNLARVEFFGFQLIEQSYWPGLAVIPPVLVSYIFYGMYINLTVGCDLTGRTYYYAWTTGAAAVVNIAANLLLIPHWGIMGTAWATLAAYLFQAWMLYLLTRKIYPVNYEWMKLSRLAVLAAACFAAARMIGDNLAVEILFLALFCALLFGLRIINREVLKSLLSVFHIARGGK